LRKSEASDADSSSPSSPGNREWARAEARISEKSSTMKPMRAGRRNDAPPDALRDACVDC
jgi:hypothetical protein